MVKVIPRLIFLIAYDFGMENKPNKIDSDFRLECFKKEYLALVKKYECDFISFPRFVQSPASGAYMIVIDSQLFDKKSVPVPSPIASKDGKIIE